MDLDILETMILIEFMHYRDDGNYLDWKDIDIIETIWFLWRICIDIDKSKKCKHIAPGLGASNGIIIYICKYKNEKNY